MDTIRRIRKVKQTPEGKWQLTWETPGEGDEWDAHSTESKGTPANAFMDTLKALAPYVVEMLELPQSDLERLTVRGITVSWTVNASGGDDIMGATITALRELRYSNCPQCLNTPHKFSQFTSGGEHGDEKQLLPCGAKGALYAFMHHALRYVDGERGSKQGQAALPFDDASAQGGFEDRLEAREQEIVDLLSRPTAGEEIAQCCDMGLLHFARTVCQEQGRDDLVTMLNARMRALAGVDGQPDAVADIARQYRENDADNIRNSQGGIDAVSIEYEGRKVTMLGDTPANIVANLERVADLAEALSTRSVDHLQALADHCVATGKADFAKIIALEIQRRGETAAVARATAADMREEAAA